MKKFLFIAFAFAALCSVMPTVHTEAQTTTPRFGTGPNNDNTGRVLNYNYVNLTDVTGTDTATLRPNAYTTIYRIALTDGMTLRSPVVNRCMAGDELIIVASAPSGTPVLKIVGTNWVTAGNATLSTNLRAVIKFIFDGAKWVEASRVVQ